MSLNPTYVSTVISSDDATMAAPNLATITYHINENSIANLADVELWLSTPWWATRGGANDLEPSAASELPPMWTFGQYYQFSGSESFNVPVDMEFAGDGFSFSQVIESATLELDANGGGIDIIIRVYFWHVCDLQGYPEDGWPNLDKFTANRSGVTPLQNVEQAVYNYTKVQRSFLTVNDSGTWHIASGQTNYTARWYNSDNLGAPQTLITDPAFALSIGGNAATIISPADNTRITFTGAGSYTILWLAAIEATGANNDDISPIEAWSMNVADLPGSNGAPATAQTFTQFADNLQPVTVGDAACIFATGNTAGTNYIEIDPTKVTPGQRWRFIAVVEDGSSKRYSFISNEYRVLEEGGSPETLPPVGEPNINSNYYNYNQRYPTRCMTSAPHQRYRHEISVAEGDYNTAGNTIALLDGLKRVEVSGYYETTAPNGQTYRHVVYQGSGFRTIDANGNTVWRMSSNMGWSGDVLALYFWANYRLRHDPNTPNIITYIDGPNLIQTARPLGNQDWLGRVITFEWRLVADAQTTAGTAYETEILYSTNQQVEQYEQDNFTFDLLDTQGNPINALCEGETACVKVTKADTGDDPVIWYGRPISDTTANLVEHDAYDTGDSVLEQLQSGFLLPTVPSAFASNEAEVCLNPDVLEKGERFELSLTRFCDPPQPGPPENPCDCYLYFKPGIGSGAVQFPKAQYNGPRSTSQWSFETWYRSIRIGGVSSIYAYVELYNYGGRGFDIRQVSGPTDPTAKFLEVGAYVPSVPGNTQYLRWQSVEEVLEVANEWTHIVFLFEPHMALPKLYINGVEKAMQNVGTPGATQAYNYDIGLAADTYPKVDEGAGRVRNGGFFISGLRIYDQHLTEAEIVGLYTAGRCYDASGDSFSVATLESQVPFGETSGTTAPELNGNDGTLIGFPAGRTDYGGGAWPECEPIDPQCGLRIQNLTNPGEHVVAPFAAYAGATRVNDKWTLEIWFEALTIPAPSTASCVASLAADSDYTPDEKASWAIGFDEDGALVMGFTDASLNIVGAVTANGEIATGQRYHVVIQVPELADIVNMGIYINSLGKSVTQQVVGTLGSYDNGPNQKLFFATHGLEPAITPDPADVIVSGFRIYDDWLTEAEIADQFAAGPCASAIGKSFDNATLYSEILFDESTGTTAAEGVNGNDGTLVGMGSQASKPNDWIAP